MNQAASNFQVPCFCVFEEMCTADLHIEHDPQMFLYTDMIVID